MALGFWMLGPFEVTDGRARLHVVGSSQQALLLDLLLAGGAPRSVDRLVEDLVGGNVATGRDVIHTRLARLRRSLGAAAGMIVRADAGYALQLDDEVTVDVDRFTRLVSDARRVVDAGEHEQGAQLYREAERLWRGDALEGFRDYPFALAEATRLEEMRVAAFEERVELDLVAGRHREVVVELRDATAQHPLRERLWGQLALALYQAGRQTDALRALHELRAALGEVGVVPAPELHQLEQAILGHDPALVLPRPDRATVSLAAPAPAAAREGLLPLALEIRANDLAFVGRVIERDALGQAWKAAIGGESRIVLLSGDIGVGKTRLLAEAARDASAEGTVLYGRCDEDLALPYQPFAEAIRHHLTTVASHRFLRSLGPHAEALGHLVPELQDTVGDRAAGKDENSGEVQLFEAIAAFLRALAAERPLLVVLDDLHWAGRGTLLLLRYLARSHRIPRMLLVLSWSDCGVPPKEALNDLVSDLRREPGTESIRLPALTEEETVALVGLAVRRPSADLDLRLVRRLHDLTEGNAFFVLQVLAQRDREMFLADTVAGRPTLNLAQDAQEAIARRVKRLSPQTQTLLAFAAVIGTEFNLVLLRRAAGVDLSPVLDALDEAVRAGVIVEQRGRPGSYRYAHRLVRQVLYESFTDIRRAQLHLTIGEQLEQQRRTGGPVHPAVLAYHFTRGASLDSARRGAPYALEAGRLAAKQGAFERAAAQFRRGLQALAVAASPDDEELRIELLLALAAASRQLLEVDEMRSAARRAVTAARAAARPDLLARAAVALGATTTHGTSDAESIELCEEALDRLPRDADGLRAQVMATLSWQCQAAGDPERARTLAERAVAAARATGETADLGLALLARGWSLVGSHHVREVDALANELLDLTRHSGDPQLYAYAVRLRGPARLALGDRDGFDDDAAQLARLADVSANRSVAATVDQWAAMVAMADGRLDDAERAIARVIERGRGLRDFQHVVATQHIWLALLRDEPHAVRPLLDELVVAADAIPGFRAAYALVLVRDGDTAAARAQLDVALAGGVGGLKQDVTFGGTLAALADAAVAVGSVEQREELLCALRPFRGLHVVGATGTHWDGPFDTHLERLARGLHPPRGDPLVS